jgi:hypothetical protein
MPDDGSSHSLEAGTAGCTMESVLEAMQMLIDNVNIKRQTFTSIWLLVRNSCCRSNVLLVLHDVTNLWLVHGTFPI